MSAVFEWPDPIDPELPGHVPPRPAPGDYAGLPVLRPEDLAGGLGVHSAERHRRHEHAGGDPSCPSCVFTPDGFQTHNCRSCTRPIVWAKTDDGNVMPVDASADPAGNVVLSRRAGTVRVTVLDQASLFDDGVRRTSHFATCPDANGWRKPR